MPATVRISETGKDLLSQLAHDAHTTMTEVLDLALESYRRQRFLEQSAEAYAGLSEVDAAAYHQQIQLLDATAEDGLKPYHS